MQSYYIIAAGEIIGKPEKDYETAKTKAMQYTALTAHKTYVTGRLLEITTKPGRGLNIEVIELPEAATLKK